MDLRLKGKTAFVTGGSHGLGGAICRVFAEEGTSVIINYHKSHDKAVVLAEELSEKYCVKTITVRAMWRLKMT